MGKHSSDKEKRGAVDVTRNKRMFGALMGHLNKAKESLEDSKHVQLAKKRDICHEKIQAKIDEQVSSYSKSEVYHTKSLPSIPWSPFLPLPSSPSSSS